MKSVFLTMSLVILAAAIMLGGCAQTAPTPSTTAAPVPAVASSAAPVTAATSVAPATTANQGPVPKTPPGPPPSPKPTPSLTTTPSTTPPPNPYTPPPTTTTTRPATTTPTPKIIWTPLTTGGNITYSDATYTATITANKLATSGYFYKPLGKEPFPAVLVLHGEEGLNTMTRDRAYWFSQQGYVAFAPDYLKPFGINPGKIDSSFYKDDVDSVRELLAYCVLGLRALPYVSKERIGIYGHSLGGYLSLIVSTRGGNKATISCSGAYAPAIASKYTLDDIVAQMPAPVLIFHGEADDVVPVSDANALADILKKRNKQYEMVTYPGTGHIFDVKQMDSYSEKSTLDYQQKMVAFLKAKMP